MTDETMYQFFNDKIEDSKDADEALKWSEAMKNTVEANNNEYQTAQKNETEIKKEKIKGIASLCISAATIIAAGIKLFEVLEFQGRDQEFEKSGYYVNHKRHRP